MEDLSIIAERIVGNYQLSQPCFIRVRASRSSNYVNLSPEIVIYLKPVSGVQALKKYAENRLRRFLPINPQKQIKYFQKKLQTKTSS